MPRKEPAGIRSPEEAALLGHLHSAGRALSSSQLAAATGYKRIQTVTERLRSLEGRGLIERRKVRIATGGSAEDHARLTREGHKAAKSELRNDAIEAHPVFAYATQVPADAKFVCRPFPAGQRREHDQVAVEYAITLADRLAHHADREPVMVRWTAERNVPLPTPPGGWPRRRPGEPPRVTASHYHEIAPHTVTTVAPYDSRPLSLVRPDATVVEYFRDAALGEAIGVEYLIEFVRTWNAAKLRDKLRNYDAMFCSWAAHVPHWCGGEGFLPVAVLVVHPHDLTKILALAESVCVGQVSQRIEEERFRARITPTDFPGRRRIFICTTTTIGNIAADLRARRSGALTGVEGIGRPDGPLAHVLGADPSLPPIGVEMLDIARFVGASARPETTLNAQESDAQNLPAKTPETTPEFAPENRENGDIPPGSDTPEPRSERLCKIPAQGHLF